MEIKRINNLSNSYPKKTEISESEINGRLLKKWKTIGLSSVMLNGLLGLYANSSEVYARELSGDVVYIDENIIEKTNTVYTKGETENYTTSTNTTKPKSKNTTIPMIESAIFSIVVIAMIILGGFVFFAKQRARIEEDITDDDDE